MPTTTNFGWTTPADTDLVKDGALAIRTLGNGIDTSMVDLKGGTTGQILSKASNTDMDFTWIANDQGDITAVTAGTGISGGGTSGAVTITNSMATEITAAGDIIVGTGSGTFDNLPIGTTGQVLTADTTVSPYKVKWASASSTPSFIGVSVSKSAAQSLTNNTYNTVTWDTEQFDTDGFHSTSSNTSRFTIPTGKGGKYLFTGRLTYATNATGYRISRFLLNGTDHWINGTWVTATTSDADSIVYTTWIQTLSAGDYFEWQAFQNSGGAIDLRGDTGSRLSTQATLQYLGA